MSNLSDYKLTISTNDDLSLTGSITANNITVSSNLTVQGTTTTVETATLSVADNKVILNSDVTGTPSLDATFEVERGTSTNTSIRWNETTDKWQQTRDGSTYVDIPINTTELSEGTNQYFTNARARAAISVTGSGSYDNSTGVITVTGGVTSVNTLTGAVTLSTTNISEGTNLYYTDTRANTAFDNRLAAKTTTNLTEGTNLYYTDTRANTAFDNRLATKSTSNVAEGTNLYYTTARANSAMAAFTGNLTAGNASLGNLVTANYFTGTLTTAAQPNITSTGTLTSLNVTGTITGGNLTSNAEIAGYGALTLGNIANATATKTRIVTAGAISYIQTGNGTAGSTGNVVFSPTLDSTARVSIDTSSGNLTATGNITGANLIAGSSGTGNVYAGNVIVNGQPTTYGVANLTTGVVAIQATATGTVAKNYAKYTRTASQSVSANSVIVCNVAESSSGTAVSVNTSTGQVTLTAGTYRLRGTAGTTVGSIAASLIGYGWYNETTSAWVGEGAGWVSPSSTNYNVSTSGTAEYVITVASTTVVSLRVIGVTGVTSIGGNQSDFAGTYANPWIDIEQIGSTFALNTLDTMTTTGNVSVGGNLSVTGNITSTPVGFRATTPVTNVSVNNSSSATMLFGTEEVDTKNLYDPATGRFTPNVAGYYSVSWFIVTSANGAGELLVTLAKNGTDIAWGTNVVNATGHWNGTGGSIGMVYLNGTTDYINVKLTNNSGSTATVYSGSLSYFSAHLIR
jgi:hypothetical protein